MRGWFQRALSAPKKTRQQCVRAGRGGFGASGQGSLLARGDIYTELRLGGASMEASGKEHLQVPGGRESIELELQEKAGPCGWSRV